jgi:hypothetical protein
MQKNVFYVSFDVMLNANVINLIFVIFSAGYWIGLKFVRIVSFQWAGNESPIVNLFWPISH